MPSEILHDIFSLLEQYGVNFVVCSPGSRNAALLLEAERNETLRKLVVTDERAAAFVALGIATVQQKPVALVCTSGSALLNYAPAVAEAYYQGVPLVVVSADRPLEWIDQDDSQTIRQHCAISNIVKRSYDIDGEREEETYLWYANRLLNEGLAITLKPKEGPVHFNIHLSGEVNESRHIEKDIRKVDTVYPPRRLDNAFIKDLAEEAASKKIMVVAGFMPPDNRLQKAMARLERLPNVCVMAETLSNLHLNPEAYCIDPALFPLPKAQEGKYMPEIIISFGGALVSRKLKEFLRRCRPGRNLYVGYSDGLVDCFQSVTDRLECEVAPFIQTFSKLLEKKIEKEGGGAPGFRETWHELRERHAIDFKSLKWSDLQALHILFNALPAETNLFLSNGTSVRYNQIIPYPLTHGVWANRGVSGIEGSTSTAVGGALVYDKLTCLVSGDMSFGYDLGGLACGLAPATMRIVVVDNGGGDIFRFINATKSLSIREKYLSADGEVPAQSLAETFGWSYFYADSAQTLRDQLEEFFEIDFMPKLLHICTRGRANARILTKSLTKK